VFAQCASSCCRPAAERKRWHQVLPRVVSRGRNLVRS
jgi:hypothetical protein